MLKMMFPYLWFWRLISFTVGRWVSPDQVRHKLETKLPKAFLQRHELDPFRTDTFDAAIIGAHMNQLCLFLGPDVMVDDFGTGVIAPHNRALWETYFVDFVDRLGRKTLLDAGPGPDGKPRRLFIKGHFLAGAAPLAKRYPDARFLTVIREPAPRLQSAVNFLKADPMGGTMGSPPWTWLGVSLLRTEITYCDAEREWFERQDGVRRCVIRFSDYVRDLEGSMSTIYRDCLDTSPLPDHVPRQHPPRDRTNYILNRSLAQVGINEETLNQRLADYITWCRATSSIAA